MKEEQFIQLKEKYLDLFDKDETKFKLFIESLNNDFQKSKIYLKELKKSRESETYVFRNFDIWHELIRGIAEIEFPKTKDSERYFYERDGKKAFKFKYFISDLLEAKAMTDCPGNPKARYSMLKTELIKYLQKEKPREIQSKDLPERATEQDVEEFKTFAQETIEEVSKDPETTSKQTQETLEELQKLEPQRGGGIAGILKQKPYKQPSMED